VGWRPLLARRCTWLVLTLKRALGLCFVGGTSDLKSHNLLVSKKDGTVKLCDFGLVHTKHTTAGTPAYMAPELLNDKPFSKKCDVYAFGVLLWEVGRHRRLLVPPKPHHDGRWC